MKENKPGHNEQKNKDYLGEPVYLHWGLKDRIVKIAHREKQILNSNIEILNNVIESSGHRVVLAARLVL